MQTIQQLARTYIKHFESGERTESKAVFYKLDDDAPSELRDMVRKAHGDMLPDDFKYETVLDALHFIVDTSEDDSVDDIRDRIMSEVEPAAYNSERMAWLESSAWRQCYVDDAVKEFGHSSDGIMGDIGLGMMQERQEIHNTVLSEMLEIIEEMEAA